MKVFLEQKAQNFEDAVALVFHEAGMAGMSRQLARLFEPAINTTELRRQAEDELKKEMRRRYGKDVSWEKNNWWLVPLPLLHFQAMGLPRLRVECQPYFVAVAIVMFSRSYRNHFATLVGPMGKPHYLDLPLQFLQAVMDADMERFPVLARDIHATAWQVPGIKELVRLPNSLVKGLATELRRQPVADWLEDFGPQGHNLAPLVVGALIGLQVNPPKEEAPEPKYTYQRLHERLAEMGYPLRERQQMLGRATFELRPEMTEDEALELVLQNRI